MKISFKFSFLFFVSVLLFFACGNETSSTEPLIAQNKMEKTAVAEPEENELISISTSQFKTSEMELGQIKMSDFPTVVKANGILDVPPKGKAAVSAYQGGYVRSMEIIPGQSVRRGQVLLTLENPEYVELQQEYLEAQQQLTYLKTEADRQKILSDENIGAQKNYLKAESEYQVTRSRAAALKKRLSLLSISAEEISAENLRSVISLFAPIGGYITHVHAKKGMYLAPTDVAFEITDPSHLHLELSVFEKDILQLKKGQPIYFKIPDASGETFLGEVHLVNKMVDEEKRVITIHGHLKDDKNKNQFIPGMYVQAEIAIDEQRGAALPEAAVVEMDDQYFVLVLKNQDTDGLNFEQREVKIGATQNGIIEILNPDIFLAEDKILVKGAFNLIAEEE